MSHFSETFTKDDGEGRNVLNYDNSAALFFGTAVIGAIVVPWTILKLKRVLAPKVKGSEGPRNEEGLQADRRPCGCSQCLSKVKDLRAAASKEASEYTWWSALHAGLWIALLILCYQLTHCKGLDTHAFDPYAILNVTPESTTKEIKKAWRVLSLLVHPDRNPDNIDAQAMFILVNKAFDALTSEQAMANFQKYGNPDGPSNMKLGLGLPRFLVAEENQVFVLVNLTVIVFVLVPALFIRQYNKIRNYTASGVHNDTMKMLAFYLHNGTKDALGPEFLAASAEARQVPLRASDEDALCEIEAALEARKIPPPMLTDPAVCRNYSLLMSHCLRLQDIMSSGMLRDLDSILSSSMVVTQAMLELAFLHSWLPVIELILVLRRSLIQARPPVGASTMLKQSFGNVPQSSLLQIPFLRAEHVEAIRKISDGNIVNLKQLLRCKDGYTELLDQVFSQNPGLMLKESERNDALCFLAAVPNITIKASIVTEGADDVQQGDLAKIKINLNRLNLEPGQAAGPVHSPLFPGNKYEEFFFVVKDASSAEIVAYQRSQATTQEVDIEIPMQIKPEWPVGQRDFQVYAMCDSYAGLDMMIKIGVVIAAGENPANIPLFIHPEDAALDDNAGTLVTDYVGNLNEVSDLDSSDDIDMKTGKILAKTESDEEDK